MVNWSSDGSLGCYLEVLQCFLPYSFLTKLIKHITKGGQREHKGRRKGGQREDKERTKGGQKLKQFLKI